MSEVFHSRREALISCSRTPLLIGRGHGRRWHRDCSSRSLGIFRTIPAKPVSFAYCNWDLHALGRTSTVAVSPVSKRVQVLERMKLLSFLFRSDMKTAVIAAATSALSGIGSAGLIMAVSSALNLGALHHSKAIIGLAVAAALVAKVGGSMASSLLLGRLAQKSILNLCMGLCRRIAVTPLRQLEQIGTPRILTCLTEDVSVLSGAIQALPLLLINTVVLAGCTAYLAWLSLPAVVVLTILMGIAALCYGTIVKKAYPAIRNARLGKEALFQHFRTLTEGIKELKINRERREAFLREDLDTSAEYYRRQSLAALNRQALADGWSQMMFGVLLISLLFVLPETSRITQEQLIKFVLVAIYVMSPAWNLVRALPALATGKASLERMGELGFALDRPGTALSNSSSVNTSNWRPDDHRSPPLVELRGIAFSYGEDPIHGFTLGPLDVTLYPGELVFIIGGNGSGKSSLVKLLTGLYSPAAGEIRVDGRPVSDDDRESYRQLFSVVYSDL